MRKILTAALAAITLGVAVSAQADPYDHRYYGGHERHDNGGVAVAAGVIGLALGAAIASNHGNSGHAYYNRGYYDRGDNGGYYDRNYYDRGYYPPAYAYGYDEPYYRTCETTRWVWDPYIGRRVAVRSVFAC